MGANRRSRIDPRRFIKIDGQSVMMESMRFYDYYDHPRTGSEKCKTMYDLHLAFQDGRHVTRRERPSILRSDYGEWEFWSYPQGRWVSVATGEAK